MLKVVLLFLLFSLASATTCSQLKTIYSDAACCANSNSDTCLRTIPVCADADNGEICTDLSDHAIIKGGVSATIPTASTTVLGGVKVDGSSIIIADGIISAPIGSSSSSTTAFSGDYNDLTNKPTIPTAFSGDYNDLSNKPTIPTAFSGDYDDLTNKPTIPTAFSGDYNDLTNKPDLSNVGSSSGTPAVVSREGQVLEELVGICDGGTVGSYTWPSVTAVQATTTTYTTLSGSEIDYTPPTGATEVIYTLTIAASTSATSGVFHVRMMVDGVESGASPTIGGAESRQYGTLETIRFVLDAWTGSKTLKLEVRHHSTGTTFQMNIHKRTLTPAGATDATNELIKPILNIRAIGVQLNYINFDPTPTALISAQTFEVTQEECASAALVNSIKAQFATKFPQDTYGTLGNNEYSSDKLPHGCMMHNDRGSPTYSRVFWNPDTTDVDNPIGSGYSTNSMALRICKYANGDFVLLTDPTDKCKTIHFTLPDNLGTLAGVLQTSSTNLGIGISPTAPLHVGTGASTSISASRFECDGTGAMIEQTTGTVDNVMTNADCSALPNFESALPATTATKQADALCKTGNSYQPYGHHYVHIDSGDSNIDKMTIEECREYARKNGYSFGAGQWNSDPNGCFYQSSQVFYQLGLTSHSCGKSSYDCVRKFDKKVVEKTSGAPDKSMSEHDCRNYAFKNNRNWVEPDVWQTQAPEGCWIHTGNVRYNTASNSVQCGVNYGGNTVTCLEVEEDYGNPGTTDQNRVNACRDACSNPSQAIFTGTRNFVAASFTVEPTGGECTCHSSPASACQLESNNYVDLYALNAAPKGCFKDSSGKHYHNANDGGVCSSYFTCLRNDAGCLVQDTTTETKELSIISEKSAWFKQEVVISSDRRIKENIVDVEGAREKMRQISAKNYSYVDKRKWNGTTVGFIAQEVAQVMPEAVKIEKGFVPNLLKRVTCTYSRNVTLQMTCAELLTGRVRLFVTDENGESLLDVEVNDGVAVVDKTYTSVYAFGYEVDDFHTLEKSKLFALNFAATKELDEEVQRLSRKMDQLLSQQ